MRSLSKDEILGMNIQKNGTWNKEDSAHYKVKEAEGSLHSGHIADTCEAEWSEGTVTSVLNWATTQAVHSNAHYNEAEDPQEAQERQIDTVVLNTYTVVDPRAMMVVSLYTNIANGAMSRSRGTNDFTVWAKFSSIEDLQQFHKFNGLFISVFQDARILSSSHNVW